MQLESLVCFVCRDVVLDKDAETARLSSCLRSSTARTMLRVLSS